MKNKLMALAALMLCAVMMLGVLTACNDTANPDENKEKTEAPADGEKTEAPADGENVQTPADGEDTQTPADGEDSAATEENTAEPFDLSGITLENVTYYTPDGEATGYIDNNGEQVIPEYVFKINGIPVTLEEYRYYYRTIKSWQDGGDDTLWTDGAAEETKLTQEDADSIKEQAEMYIKQAVLYQLLAEKYDIALTEEELANIETSIQQTIDTLNSEESEMTYEQALEMDNLTDGLFRYTMKLNNIANKIFDTLYLAEDAPYGYSAEEMMDKLENDMQYVRVQHVLVSFPSAPTEGTEEEIAAAKAQGEADAKAKAQEALDKINAGADFMEIVAEYNEDPGMTQMGEDGYYFGPGYMVKEFEDASFALEEGAVSDLVKTTYGYHIIKRLPMEMDYVKENSYDLFGNEYSNDFMSKLEKTFDIMEVEYAPEYEMISPLTVK